MQRSSRKYTRLDCGLSSSLYMSCYSETCDHRPATTTASAPLLDDKSSGEVFYPIAALPQSDVRFYIGSGSVGAGQKGDVAESEDGSLLDGSVRNPSRRLSNVSEASSAFDCLSQHSVFEEECLYGLQKMLTRTLNRQIPALMESTGSPLSLLGLADALPAIISDLLHLSEEEPYGVRGANLIVRLERQPSTSWAARNWIRKSSAQARDSDTRKLVSSTHSFDSTSLGTIKICPETLTTFELLLTLREEQSFALLIKNWMSANIFKSKQTLVIKPQFSLVKRKLYR